MDTTLTVNLNGTNLQIDVIEIIKNEEENKEYIIYSIEGNEDDIYASILVESDDSYILKGIENKEEADRLEQYIKSLEADGKKEEL